MTESFFTVEGYTRTSFGGSCYFRNPHDIPPQPLVKVTVRNLTAYAEVWGTPCDNTNPPTGPGSGAKGQPWNLEQGVRGEGPFYYHAAGIDSASGKGNVQYWRSDFEIPLPVWNSATKGVSVTGSGQDADPKMVVDPITSTLWLVFARDSGGGNWTTYYTRSWDDGATWRSPVATGLAGGKHPTIAVGRDGTIVIAAYVSGNIQAQVRGPGDTDFGTAFTFTDPGGANLSVQDDTFHIQQGYDNARRWLLHVLISGDASSSHWQCWDLEAGNKASWKKVV